MVLPNVTDGFAGRAPDLGALEYGQAPPHYGPRRQRKASDGLEFAQQGIGVYRTIRHPMYSALAFYFVGQALVIPNWVAGFCNVIALAVLLALRLGAEEKMMAKQFGDEYAAYAARTKRFISGVW